MTSTKPEKALDVLLDNIQKKNSWDPDAVLKEALKERDRFLAEHPELARLQEELDRNLESVENFEDRMRIIGKMIGQRLNQMNDECEKLETMLDDMGIHAEFPITRFKQSLQARKTFLIEDDDDE